MVLYCFIRDLYGFILDLYGSLHDSTSKYRWRSPIRASLPRGGAVVAHGAALVPPGGPPRETQQAILSNHLFLSRNGDFKGGSALGRSSFSRNSPCLVSS